MQLRRYWLPVVLSLVLPWSLLATARPVAGPVLEVPRVASLPVLDGRLEDPAWSAAGRLEVTVRRPVDGGGEGEVALELRAVHDGRRLALAVSWPDPTLSVAKRRWLYRGGRWSVDESEDEDQFVLLLPQGEVTGFAESGCLAACHGDQMRSPGRGQRLDAWHWSALRTAPLAWCDDEWWDETPRSVRAEAGRAHDAADGAETGAVRNQAGERPAFEPRPGLPPSPYLRREDAVPFRPAAPRGEGATVPGYVLSRPGGSRADVDAVAQWHDGRWQLELGRALDTGHDDDVVLVPGGEQLFSVALFDRRSSGADLRQHGMAPGPYRLELAR